MGKWKNPTEETILKALRHNKAMVQTASEGWGLSINPSPKERIVYALIFESGKLELRVATTPDHHYIGCFHCKATLITRELRK